MLRTAPGALARVAPGSAHLAQALLGQALPVLALAALAPGCIIVERHYYPVGGPVPAGAPEAAGAAPVTSAPAAPQGPGEARRDAAAAPAEPGPPAQDPAVTAAQFDPPQYPPPSGEYDSQLPLFAFTVDASLEVDDKDALYGFGMYIVPAESPLGFYMNTRFTAHSYDYPDLTHAFSYNAFGHDVVDEELHAFVFNFGLVKPLIGEALNLFAGLGYAYSETEVELHDPAGVFGDHGTYFQRIDDDDDFNVNVGLLLLLDALALNAQWDTALEVFSFGVGFAF